jgi:uncharacterized protein (TIGR00266 family)
MDSEFDFTLEGQPDFAFLTVKLPAGGGLQVEASAMATMDTSLRMSTKMKGGLKRMLTGENLFINEFRAEKGPGEIGIAPGSIGDIAHYHLTNEAIFLSNSAFLASGLNVVAETKWQGLKKGFFSGGGFFLVKCSGAGSLWFTSFGALLEMVVDTDVTVDTGHVVAFTEGLEYEVRALSDMKTRILGGEGLVCNFKGRGRLWIQTRNTPSFAHWAHPFRPTKSKGGGGNIVGNILGD